MGDKESQRYDIMYLEEDSHPCCSGRYWEFLESYLIITSDEVDKFFNETPEAKRVRYQVREFFEKGHEDDYEWWHGDYHVPLAEWQVKQ